MPVERHDINVNDLSDGDLILKTRDFGRRCEENAAFKEGVNPCVPGPANYRELADALTAAVEDGPGGNPKEVEAIRERIVRSMTYSTQYIVMFSDHHGDPGIMKTIGFELKTRSYKKATHAGPPPRPLGVTVTDDTEEQGTISIKVSNRPRNGSVEVQVSEGSPTDEASYWRLGNFYACRFKAKGLAPVKKYHVRCRFDTPSGPGPWSEIITVVVS